MGGLGYFLECGAQRNLLIGVATKFILTCTLADVYRGRIARRVAGWPCIVIRRRACSDVGFLFAYFFDLAGLLGTYRFFRFINWLQVLRDTIANLRHYGRDSHFTFRSNYSAVFWPLLFLLLVWETPRLGRIAAHYCTEHG